MTLLETAPLGAIDFDPFAGPAIARTAPATDSQREIWAATTMGSDASCAFNESNALDLVGRLDVDALRDSFNALIARHEALRSTFTRDGTTMVVAESLNINIPLHDYSTLDDETRQARLDALRAREVEEPFDLERGPLVRANLIRLATDHHLFVMTAHHLVCDGWSTGVMMRDLGALYSAEVVGETVVLPEATPFATYALQRSLAESTPEYAEAEDWWVHQFADDVPALDLPFDRSRPALKTFSSRREDVTFSADLVARLKRTGAASGASLFTMLLAGFDVLLHRISGAEDVVVGIPWAGQASAGESNLVGHCVNTLPIRCQAHSDEQFVDVLGRVRTAVLDASDRPDYTFGRLVRKLAIPRDPSRLPLVSVLFNLDQAIDADDLQFAGLVVNFSANPRHFENFDLFLNAVETETGLRLECQYNTDLLDGATVRRWLCGLEVLLAGVCDDPRARIGNLPILTEADRRQLAEWNNTQLDYPSMLQVHELVEQQVQRSPQVVAVECGDDRLTYSELSRRSNQLAHRLRALGVKAGVRVGLCVERSVDMLVALLAVSKAGGAYVPLDPAYPHDRIAFMLNDAGVGVLITQEALKGGLPETTAQVLSIDGDAASITSQSVAPVERLPESSSENILYVIYTSGSTGTPKGVLVPHRTVTNLLTSAQTTPGLNAGDVVMAITTLSFDIAVFDLWLPLVVGARIVVAPRHAGGDGPLLLDLLRRSGATVLQATPSTWRLLIDAGWQGGDNLKVISTGEALPLSLAQELVARSHDVWNMYGPTETTVWSTQWRLPRQVASVVIGQPMANTSLHVLDRDLQPVPIGVPGELFIGGEGVTLGYLDRPELTAERFVANPFANGSAARLYRTGDLVRWRSDGMLEYLGRNDHQVKIRGFRIELGEIEALLSRQPSVAQAYAMAREDRPGDTRLVAYIVARPGESYSETDLRTALSSQLPQYMVPQHLVQLAALPLTPNGKVNRAGLPAPELPSADDRAYVAPATETEKLVAEIWQDILGIGRVGIHDDFFQLGGHSLLAAQVASRLARDHGLAVPMRSLFEAPTIAQFAPALEQTPRVVQIPRRTGSGPAQASIMQRRSTLLEQIGSNLRTFNLPAAWRLQGDLDPVALRGAINAFIQRQEATRTTLRWYGDAVVQTIAPELELDVPVTDLREVDDSRRETELMQRMLAATDERFDLTQGPLIRMQLFRMRDDEHVLFLLVHHAIWDGWSFDLFVREIDNLYSALRRGEAPSRPALQIQYADFAEWHNAWLESPAIAEHVAYWHTQLADELPPLELPVDRPRPKLLGDAGATEWIEISRGETEALRALGQENGVTLFVVLLAAYETLLHRYSGQSDFLIGTPVRGRSQPELEDIVGWFVNTIVLRARLGGDPTVLDLLQQVRTTVLDGFSHQDVPFEQLLMSKNPAYRAFFSFQDARRRPVAMGDLSLRQLHVLPDAAANDISLWIMENESGLVGGFNYSTELFDRETVQRLLASFRMLLRAIVADPEQPISALRLTSESDGDAGRIGPTSAAPATPLRAAFQARVDATPDALALAQGGLSLTYAQLDAQANALAQHLRAMGSGPSTRIALAASGAQRVIGALAVLMSGSALLPVDATQPSAWLSRIFEVFEPTIVIADSEDVDFEAGEAAIAIVAGNAEGECSPQRIGDAASSSDTALLACTIGTDGDPVGIELSHADLSRVLSYVGERADLAPADRLLVTGQPGSGRHTLGLLLPLVRGACLILDEDALVDDADALAAAIAETNATGLVAQPQSWQQLVDANWQGASTFLAVLDGAQVPTRLARDVASRTGRAYSLYGQAETGLWTGLTDLASVPESGSSTLVPLGQPIPGDRWHVVDSQLHDVPIGVPGELLVQSDRAQQVRTGDLVRQRADGAVEYIRRTDNRLSLGGCRIEPGAVEQVLKRHAAIEDAAVDVRLDGEEERLVAWIVTREGADYTETELRRTVRRNLPENMVPRRYLEVKTLPRKSDGGIDRARLPEMPGTRSTRQLVAPRSDAEQLLASIWGEALSLDNIGIHDNFFELGGHSLLCIQVIARVEKQSGCRLNPRLLLLNTLEQVAAELSSTSTAQV